MNLFKNEVGRPTNELKRKRKMFYFSVFFVCLFFIMSLCLFINSKISLKQVKGSTANSCNFPYSRKKCGDVKNETVKKVQEMLKKLGYFTADVNGYLGPQTEKAIKAYQKAKKLTQNGVISGKVIRGLVKDSKQNTFYHIYYDRNGGTGDLIGTSVSSSSSDITFLMLLKGIETEISPSILRKDSNTHIGYSATYVSGKVTYRYGCYQEKCLDTGNNSAKWEKESDIENNKKQNKEFYNYIFVPGKKIKNLDIPIKNEDIVNMKAEYCGYDTYFDEKVGYCKKQEFTTTTIKEETKTIASYNKCNFPYTKKKCQKVYSETVKEVQNMLKTLGYYKYSVHGYLDVNTEKAVKAYQRKKKLNDNGVISGKVIKGLVAEKKINKKHFVIGYEKNGGTGNFVSTSTTVYTNRTLIFQMFVNGASEEISPTILNKTGKAHVGYTAKTTLSGKTYFFGCLGNKNCSTIGNNGAKWIEESEITNQNSNGIIFYEYVFDIAQRISDIGNKKNAQEVTFTAYYCDSGKAYDKSTSSCVNEDKIKGKATGYLISPLGASSNYDFSKNSNNVYFPRRSANGAYHGSIDIPLSVGVPIYAMDGGIVSAVGSYTGNCYSKGRTACNGSLYGTYVKINHNNGYNSVYAHLSKRVVNNGEYVSKGQLIGYSGNTGYSSGGHLHFELQNISLLATYGREAARQKEGKGLMNPCKYINKSTTYVGKTK